MGGQSDSNDQAQADEQELEREKQQKVREAELMRVQLLKRAQGGAGGGLGNIFSGVNDKLG